MILGVDGNEANVRNRVGIGIYAYELLTQFGQFASDKLQFTVYLKSSPLFDMPKETSNWKYRVVWPKRFWTQFGLPIDLFLHKRPNVFFTPSHYAPRFSPVPTAISIMDLSYVHFPQLFKKSDLYQLNNWTRYSVRKAKRIFTISLASKDDIIREYKVASDKVTVTYPGTKPTLSAKSRMKKGNYILFVGTLQPRKNIERLVEAFAKIKTQFPELELFIVGKKGWLYEEILKAPTKYGVSDSVKFLGFVDDTGLPKLYQEAQCFILPSLYEGFGLPLLEAMKYGCPVITSNVSSLPEVGGEAALYVDPQSAEDIAEKLAKVLSDSKLRAEMTKKGYAQVKKFSWEKTAKETLEALEEIANGK